MMSELNGFTTKEILVGLEKKIDRVLADHETRLRSNESSISRIKGALILLSVTVPIVVGLLASYIH